MAAPTGAPVEPEIVREVTPSIVGLEAQTRGEIDIQIATAKRYPRSVTKAMQDSMSLATLNEEIAEQCFYAVPRDGKTIEGPSARLAEIVASCWGHMRSEARITEETDRYVTARGTSWDLERNVAVAFEVRRRITNKNGKRYGDDMIVTASNAANSIAYRNTVFRVVPKAFWWPVYEAARKVAIGDAKTLANKRSDMLGYFQKMGVTPDRVFAVLGVHGVDDVTLEHLGTLKGLANAIKEGDTSVDEAFPATPKEPQRVAEAPRQSAPNATATSTTTATSATPTPAPKEGNGNGASLTERGAKILETKFIAKSEKSLAFHEITTSRGVFLTMDEQLAKSATSCEGTDHEFALTWKWAKRQNGERIRMLLDLTLDEDTSDPTGLGAPVGDGTAPKEGMFE